MKREEFADNFKFDENARKFSKQLENTVGKEEIARYEQFFLFPTVFSKDMYCRHIKTRACLGNSLTFPKQQNQEFKTGEFAHDNFKLS